MTDKQLMQDAYDALCVAFAGRQGVAEWEQNETLRAALRERLAQPIASGQAPPLLGRVELQREAKHPAPCASHCEAPAFKIEIRQLKTQIEVNRAQPPAQQPLSDAQINSACLSRDHSFGLMDANKRALMICSAREWERAFAKEKP
jgi:hypothetical protein